MTATLDTPPTPAYFLSKLDGRVDAEDYMNATGIRLLDAWCRSMRARNLSKRTVAAHFRTISVFITWADENRLSIEQVTHRDIDRWLSNRTLSAKTRYTYTSQLATFYGWCVREELLDHDPTLRVDRPKQRRYLPRPAGLAVVMAAIDNASPRVSLMLAFAAFAGARRFEVAQIRVEDIRPGIPPLVLLHGKGGRDRLVPLHDEVIAALSRYDHPLSGWLFPSTQGDGMALTADYAGTLMTAALVAAGEHLTPHTLRHLFGTNAYAGCQDIRVVQELMGHSSPATTAVYTQFSPVIAARTVMGLPSRLPEVEPNEAA